MAEPLPQLAGDRLFIGDGGLETSLIFHQGLELPDFAAFTLLKDDAGREAIRAYFEPYLAIARDGDVGFVLDTVTWRASPDWAARLGYSPEALDQANRDAVAVAEELAAPLGNTARRSWSTACSAREGDGYVAGDKMSAEEAESYHARQVATFAGAGADMVTAVTMTYAAEATGIVRAAAGGRDLRRRSRSRSRPTAACRTASRWRRRSRRWTPRPRVAAAYFMINCAHPTHFEDVLAGRARRGWSGSWASAPTPRR